MEVVEVKYLGFLYKIGQWVRDEEADVSRESALKLLSMIEVLLVNIDPTKKFEVTKRLNAIVEQ